MTSPLLEFDQVNKQFAGKAVLNNINLIIEPGMVMGLLGRNGAGKTTLLRIALGLISQNTGVVRCLDSDNRQLSPACKQRIGYVPQQPCGYQGFKVNDALALHKSFYPNWDSTLEQTWLSRLELDGNALVSNLSGGQQQSLALIMAMSYRPQLLILDEPVSSLDPIARRAFMSDLFELALEAGSGVLFSSHITSDVERIASHIAIIKDGEVLVSGELDSLKEQIKIVPNSASDPLPGATILHQSQRSTVYQASSCNLRSKKPEHNITNLEQLFVELHQ
ncbi:ABC transporter ATP-binding protein [Pseudoalteromonas sp. McH1-7]|uniref:ABC transporter ATP-binding protein n=1 Tax=Pseudoalteromonas TaxID=53246 RepID=UPI00159291EF|nr:MULTISPECIES: ABC transporter ATP-binding protein [Pseudoalteromonas]MDW7549975.1 ABC transporter ATP-binding protein [Pseudoalteromonas peptidolytica]NUZ09514.1 ABC transporter ATP-binding protein [Pseudoalteromonas sp. McH1-7]